VKEINWRTLLRAARWHKRAIGICALVISVLAAFSWWVEANAPGIEVVVSTHAIPANQQVSSGDVKVVRIPADAVPKGALTSTAEALGRRVVHGISEGAVLGADAFSSATLVSQADGEVLVPVHLADEAAMTLLRVGSNITIVGSSYDGYVTTLASSVRVALLPGESSGGLVSTGSGAVILVACPRNVALTLAGAGDQRLNIIIE
jgi:hypothetical protein